MNNTHSEWQRQTRAVVTWLGFGLGLMTAHSDASTRPKDTTNMQHQFAGSESKVDLTPQQRALIPIAVYGSIGDMPKLEDALVVGLESGLSVNEIKEVLIQLYAYAGFPRSLNAMERFMNVVAQRKSSGIADRVGEEPRKLPLTGEALLAAGTATQTQLIGSPVDGPLFEFAPVMNTYLRTHLFGDIFNRDNLGWQNRELATLGMLSGLNGVQSQLKAHIRIAKNAGITDAQLAMITLLLAEKIDHATALRFEAARVQ